MEFKKNSSKKLIKKSGYIYFVLMLIIILSLAVIAGNGYGNKSEEKIMNNNIKYETATFAGGCFWCIEAGFEKIEGVVEAVSGYTGGHVENPSYEQVTSGTSGHYEAVQIKFDPEKINYTQLLDRFFRQIDPTDNSGSFVDRGENYKKSRFKLLLRKLINPNALTCRLPCRLQQKLLLLRNFIALKNITRIIIKKIQSDTLFTGHDPVGINL